MFYTVECVFLAVPQSFLGSQYIKNIHNKSSRISSEF